MPFRLPRPRQGVARRAFGAVLSPALERALAFHRLNDIYRDVTAVDDGRPFAEKVLEQLNVQVDINPAELDRIPRTGPLIVVANHPFGAVDGIILMSILHKARPDAKVMANFLLGRIRELRRMLICVDPFDAAGSKARNLTPLKQAIRHVKAGGALGSFPAGEVAHFHLNQRSIVDPPWSQTIGRIARRSGATVLPLYFHGRNSQLFQVLGMIHPRLRTAMLPRELLKKRTHTIKVRIGHPIPPARLDALADDRRLTDFLRTRTYLLAAGLHRRRPKRGVPAPAAHEPAHQPIIDPVPRADLWRQIAALPAETRVVDAGEQAVYCVGADQAPLALREIGRLRELAFRAVGEGTGRPLDLDRFDDDYRHLFVWHRIDQQIVGAYRIATTEQIIPRRGIAGLYTHTLFDYGRELIEQIAPAMELGRSFVNPQYQRNYTALMNLWKGIGTIAARNPRCCRLLGPVSISNDYHDLSRQLMVQFLNANRMAPELARLCRARNPMRIRRRPRAVRDVESIALRDINDVSELIADIELQPRGVPILLKQYLKLGAKLLAFNIDPDFGDVLDGLILIDLRQTDPRILGRYMGRENARAFFAYHQTPATAEQATPTAAPS